jgi:hypothetical protein
LRKRFPDLTLVKLSHAVDLENSFGPIYSRGLVRRGQSGFAVIGVNREELQSSIDAALTFGVLWLNACRNAHVGKLVVEGLKLFVPANTSALVRERMAHLHRGAAKWELYELDEREDDVRQIEINDRGNVLTRLVRCPDDKEIFDRFAGPITFVRSMMSEAEIGVLPPAEISLRCRGLEFAGWRLSAQPGSFQSLPEVVLGTGSEQRVLDDSNLAKFEGLIRSIGEVRHADGPHECRWRRLIRSVGSSRWWSRIFLCWMISSIHAGVIRRCRRSQRLIAQ